MKTWYDPQSRKRKRGDMKPETRRKCSGALNEAQSVHDEKICVENCTIRNASCGLREEPVGEAGRNSRCRGRMAVKVKTTVHSSESFNRYEEATRRRRIQSGVRSSGVMPRPESPKAEMLEPRTRKQC